VRDKLFYLACFGFAAGVLWRSFLRVDWRIALFVGLIYVFLVLFSVVSKKSGRDEGGPFSNWDVFVSVFAIAFLAGVLRFHVADVPAPQIFEAHVGQSVPISGLIVDEPAISESEVKFTLETNAEGPKTRIMIFAKRDPSARLAEAPAKRAVEVADGYKYGDEVLVTGKLEKPANFMTDQGLEFDYANYLRKDGVFYVMRLSGGPTGNPKIEILSSGHGNFIKSALYSVKEKFDNAIASAIQQPESIVMRGIILGERSTFSQSLRQLFTDTGTIHVVTIGGYHVTLVAQWIMKMLGFLPIPYATAAGIFSVFLYVIVTGGAQTSIRAGIMATLALLARVTGRMYSAGRALVLAAVVMIFINPFVLAYDVSFELSFMATIAIIFLSPRIEKYFAWIRWRWLRDIVAITLSMYVFALPFILYRMGILSLVALPANILIVPLVPITMITGFITGFAGMFSSALAFVPGKIAYVILHYMLAVIGALAHLPFAAFAISNFPLALVVFIYILFAWIFFSGYGQEKTSENSGSPVRPHGQVRPHRQTRLDRRLLILLAPLILTLTAAGFLYYRHYQSNQAARSKLQTLLVEVPAAELIRQFVADARTKSSGCNVAGHYPDRACTPGAVFTDATVEQICVKGYTASVRNVSTNLRKEVFAEYDMAYPQPRGAYEVDHFIPLALAGSNDIANLFPEAAEPTPGFHEKDIVEVYLQGEVCSGRVALPVAQRQISTDWLLIYNNLTPEQILAIKKKYNGN